MAHPAGHHQAHQAAPAERARHDEPTTACCTAERVTGTAERVTGTARRWRRHSDPPMSAAPTARSARYFATSMRQPTPTEKMSTLVE